MEIYVILIVFLAGVIVYMYNSYEKEVGCPISEDDLDEEIYFVIGVNSLGDKVYYLLRSGSKILTCWVNKKEGFKNFDYSSEEMRLIPKNNS